MMQFFSDMRAMQKAKKLLSKATTDEMAKALHQTAITFQRWVTREKLSGQVLKRQSGDLAGSIVVSDPIMRGKEILVKISPTKPYARIHELGYKGPEKVMAYSRQIGDRVIQVSAHTRQMNMPKRSYLASTATEKADALNQDFLRRLETIIHKAVS